MKPNKLVVELESQYYDEPVMQGKPKPPKLTPIELVELSRKQGIPDYVTATTGYIDKKGEFTEKALRVTKEIEAMRNEAS